MFGTSASRLADLHELCISLCTHHPSLSGENNSRGGNVKEVETCWKEQPLLARGTGREGQGGTRHSSELRQPCGWEQVLGLGAG